MAALVVVTPALKQISAELLLQRFRQLRRRPVSRRNSRQQRRQALPQWIKQHLKPLLADIGFKRLRQDFPRAALNRFSRFQLGRLLEPQLNDVLEGRSKQAEVVQPPGLLPNGIAMGLGAHQGSDKLLVLAAVALQLQAEQRQVALMSDISTGLTGASGFSFSGLQ